jgi:hypothetical protein
MSKSFLQQKSMNDMLREQDSLSNILYIQGTMDHPNEHRAHNWKKPVDQWSYRYQFSLLN